MDAYCLRNQADAELTEIVSVDKCEEEIVSRNSEEILLKFLIL